MKHILWAVSLGVMIAGPARAQYSLADICSSSGIFADLRIASCTSIIDSDSFTGPKAIALYNRGLVYGESGDRDRALADFDESIRLNPYYDAPLLARGQWRMAAGESEAALADFSEALRLNPKNEAAYIRRAEAHFSLGQIDRAIADYDQAILLDLANYYGLAARGGASAQKQDFEKAMADLDAALALNPQFEYAIEARGMVFAQQGDDDKALAEFDRVLGLNPSSFRASFHRGYIYAGKGALDRAISDYDQALRTFPAAAEVLVARGNAYLYKGEAARAVVDFDQALGIHPKDRAAVLQRGTAYFRLGDLNRAVQDFDAAIGIEPDYFAYLSRALANYYGGKLDAAASDLINARASAPEPKYMSIWLDIVKTRGNLPGELGEASKTMDMTKWPAPVIQLLMGQMDADAALAAADDPDAKKKVEQACEAHFYIGKWRLLQGDASRSRASFQKAVEICPKDFIEYDAAHAELRQAVGR